MREIWACVPISKNTFGFGTSRAPQIIHENPGFPCPIASVGVSGLVLVSFWFLSHIQGPRGLRERRTKEVEVDFEDWEA